MSHTTSNATNDGDHVGQQQQEEEGTLEDHMKSTGSLNVIGGVNSEVAMSPRVSTIGTDTEVSTMDPAEQGDKPFANQDYSAPGLDSLHWAGVKKRGDFDQRSIASSMNAEKDDKSVYEEMGVSGVMIEEEDAIGERGSLDAAPSSFVREEEEEEEEEEQHVDVRVGVVGGQVEVRMVVMSEDERRMTADSIPAGSSACPSPSVTSPRSLAGTAQALQEEEQEELRDDDHEELRDDIVAISAEEGAQNLQIDDVKDTEDAKEDDAAAAAGDIAGATVASHTRRVVDMGEEWESTFKGLVYEEGIDALGRPVIVLDADAVPPRMKSSALTYVKTHLEPVVSAGDYVIVFTAEKAKLPTFWIMGAYQTLPRPFRKNVQYVILVRPSRFLKAILAFMRPFVSKKAGRKIKVVESLEELGEVTSGEVTMHHLGTAFLDAHHH
ncbi:hypothetical protein M9435_000776 [Picochlorum sp. BPE23]|nr:hypothetical protein M9435_000776 [Picochlorum sp. BPE23]